LIQRKLLNCINLLLILTLALSFVFTKSPDEVNGLNAETTYDTAEISWDRSDNAKGYIIYRSEDGENFDCIGETAETTYTDGDLTTGKEYSYSVAAYNGIKRQMVNEDKAIKVEPSLDAPKVGVTINSGEIKLDIDAVPGATGYEIYRDGKKITAQQGRRYTDKTAAADMTHRYTVKAYRDQEAPVDEKKSFALINEPESSVATEPLTAHSKMSGEVKAKVVSVGKMTAEINGQDIIFSWEPNEEYSVYRLYKGTELLTETSENNYVLTDFDPEETYEMKLVGFNGDTESPEQVQTFEIKSEPMTNKEAIDAACEWGVQIAEDDSFNYGECPRALHNGCYFCKTNGKKGKGYEKTYICNALVHACFAHGAGDPSMLKACKHGHSVGMTKKSYTKYGNWKDAGKPSKLERGDVLVANKHMGGTHFHHVALYLGDGKILEATRKGWSSKSIAVKPLSDRYYDRFDFVMRYTGNGGGEKYTIKERNTNERP